MPLQDNRVALILCGGDINFSDLPIITNRSNAMIPVNGKPVIGWILEDLVQKGFQEVVLVLRFDNLKLYNYVEWAFGQRFVLHFAFVQPGGTILHSLLAGAEQVKAGVGIHVVLGDTLLRDPMPDHDDFVFAGSFQNPEDWCLVKTDEDGFATEYFDKQKPTQESLHALAGIYSFSDATLLRTIVLIKIQEGAKEISQVLQEYGKTKRIWVANATEWYDFGHIYYFNLAKQKLLQSRYFNSLTIDPLRGTITKRSAKSDKLADELNWYKSLPDHLKMLSPRLEEKETNSIVTITQEYYGYPNLAELYVFGDLALSVWMNVLNKLIDIHLVFKKQTGILSSIDMQDMYVDKTQQRLNELSMQPEWKNRLAQKELVINGKKYRNYEALKAEIKIEINRMCESPSGCIIHGDYCFSNILFDLNSQVVRLIDPRGSFGSQKLYGDPRYDMAKLRHSVSGRYDFIIADLFKVSEQENGYTLQIVESESYETLVVFFDSLMQKCGYNAREIMLIEGLLFVSMVPLHKENPQRQLAMYLNGIMTLNQVFENAHRN